ncbi:hypothetical protein FRC11_006432 [Ceratobasidium sp. 423]|nr:hypothetical protein FRC11_006432 [Ceratobasidium sp. 423]
MLETTDTGTNMHSNSSDEDDAEMEVDLEPVDTRHVLNELVNDVDEDEDYETETPIEAAQSFSTPEIEQHKDVMAPPVVRRRIIFRWSQEITLDKFFNFSSTPNTLPSWSHVHKVWEGGVANLADEMHHYGLHDKDP